MADDYVCKLDERTAEKAKKELNEDPKDRLNAVDALRTWIQQQPHITFEHGVTKQNGDVFSLTHELRFSVALNTLNGRDENAQVNGYVVIVDGTGTMTKHATRWTFDDVRKWFSCWTNAMPGRFKGAHYYNIGTILEPIMVLFKSLLPKKMQERLHFHDTMESVYKAVGGMEGFPDEYLPDDYRGPSAGPMKQIIQNFKADLMDEKFRELLLRRTNEQSVNIDESKRPAFKPVNESFRKLAVD